MCQAPCPGREVDAVTAPVPVNLYFGRQRMKIRNEAGASFAFIGGDSRKKPRTRCGSAQAGRWQQVFPGAWGLQERARPRSWADRQAGTPGAGSQVLVGWGGGERVTDAGSPTAARGREGVLERWVGALQRSLCCDCVALKGWIEVVTSVARCYMQKAPTRERKTPVRGDELTSRATSSESQRREAGSKAVFKFLLLSLAAAGYCTAHFTLLSNFRGGGRTNDKMHKKKYLPP